MENVENAKSEPVKALQYLDQTLQNTNHYGSKMNTLLNSGFEKINHKNISWSNLMIQYEMIIFTTDALSNQGGFIKSPIELEKALEIEKPILWGLPHVEKFLPRNSYNADQLSKMQTLEVKKQTLLEFCNEIFVDYTSEEMIAAKYNILYMVSTGPNNSAPSGIVRQFVSVKELLSIATALKKSNCTTIHLYGTKKA